MTIEEAMWELQKYQQFLADRCPPSQARLRLGRAIGMVVARLVRNETGRDWREVPFEAHTHPLPFSDVLEYEHDLREISE